MSTSTNQLVAKRKLTLSAGIAAVAVLGSAFALHSNSVHASAVTASPLDDQSVSAITAMDNAMEALAARVTPAIVNVAVTSRGEEQQVQMQDIFEYERTGISARGKVLGQFHGCGAQPLCLERLKAYGVHLSPAIFHEVHEVRDK